MIRHVVLIASVLVVMVTALRVPTHSFGEDGELLRVVFSHRHGSREDTENINGTCGKIGCGQLTMAGERMLENLGESFLQRYSSIFPKNAATGKAKFNISSMQTRGDNSPRCIQSANAFWRGLFGSNSGNTTIDAPHLPAIDTSYGSIMQSSAPNGDLHRHLVGGDACEYAWNKSVAEGLITFDDLKPMAKEIDINCTEPCGCFHTIVGFIRISLPNGISGRYPAIMAKLQVLDAVRARIEHYEYGLYDLDVLKSGYHAYAGWRGTILADAMLDDAENDNLFLSEYSGHDTSLMPLYAALGNFSFEYPYVGTAVVFEIYSGFNKSLVVKAQMAVPNQHPSSGFPIEWSPYTLNCLDASGKEYAAASCPMVDLRRYIRTRYPAGTGPKASPDWCRAFPSDLVAWKCTPDDNDKKSLKGQCGDYRQSCPFAACGSSHYLVANMSCVPK